MSHRASFAARLASRSFAPKAGAMVLLALLLLFTPAALPAQADPATGTIYRVVTGGASSGDCGDSWANACSLQHALKDLADGGGDEIWVAAGTYTPGAAREDTFQLKNGVALYGGFAGTESERSQRDWRAQETILSGDIGIPGDSADNSYHVVTGSGTDRSAVLDGFTVTRGNADTLGSFRNMGAGMYNNNGSPTVRNVRFEGNSASSYAGGMYNRGSLDTPTSPALTNVVFGGNAAGTRGGGMYNWYSNPALQEVTFRENIAATGGGMFNDGSSPTLTNVEFLGNRALASSTGYDACGGGMHSQAGVGAPSSPTLINVVFNGNWAYTDGGGMYNTGSSLYAGSPTLINVTFSGNHAQGVGGAIYNGYSSPQLVNAIVWGNTASLGNPGIFSHALNSQPTYRYSIIQGTLNGSDDAENISSVDPLFVSVPGVGGYGDLRLQATSPAIDAGDSSAVPDGVSTDLAGNPRIAGARVDLGAYEAQGAAPQPKPDLTLRKTNSTNGVGAPGTAFNWTLALRNAGSAAASFGSGQVILRDDLPSGASYGTPQVTAVGGLSGNVSCAIDGSANLVCTANGAVSIPAPGAGLDVVVPVTPTAIGTLSNPRVGGVCKADPGEVVAESDETNNSDSDAVTVVKVTPTVTGVVHDVSQNPVTVAPFGTSAHAHVTAAGPAGMATPSGWVYWSIYANTTCSGDAIHANSAQLWNGVSESPGITLLENGLSFKASYTGDSVYNAAECGCLPLSVVQPPTIAIAFSPASVVVQQAATLQVTLTNPNSSTGLTGVRFGANLPLGLVVANPPNVSNGCGGTVTATAGGSTISLLDGTLPAGGSCSFAVNVVSARVGSYAVQTFPVYAAESSAGSASNTATLTVKGATATMITNVSPSGVSLVGEPVRISFSVVVTPTLAAAPSATVHVQSGSTLLGSAPVAQGYCDLAGLAAGDYAFTATYEGDGNLLASTSAPVAHLVNTPPVARPGGPYSVDEGMTIAFDGSASSDPDGDSIIAYAWSFGDGSTGSGASTTHTYAASGSYVATLTVTDEHGATGVATTTVTVRSVAPSFSGQFDQAAREGTLTTFSLGSLVDSDVDGPWSLSVDWGDGLRSTFSVAATGALTANHLYDDDGTYTVTVQASDRHGASDSQSFNAIVRNVAPKVRIDPRVTPGVAGTQVGLWAQASDPSHADTRAGFDYQWSLRRDGVEIGTGSASSLGFDIPAGDTALYEANLTVRDKDGGTGSTSWHTRGLVQAGGLGAVDARIQALWPHGGAAVRDASLANLSAWLLEPGTLRPAQLAGDPTVLLWRALNNEPGEVVATGVRRGASMLFDFNNVDVSAARDARNKLYFYISVEGVPTRSNVWAHAQDARTRFPAQDVPTGTGPVGGVVDARIEILWPHGNARVTAAGQANLTALLCLPGTLTSVPAEWGSTVRLYRALDNGVGEQVAIGVKRLVTQNGITYPVWDFDNIDVSAAQGPAHKLLFSLAVDGVETHTNVWLHGVDGRTIFPQWDAVE